MNCKPGDLAVVIAAYKTKTLVGRFVIVVRACNGTEKLDGLNWRVNGKPAWVIKSASGGTLPVYVTHGPRKGQVVEVAERALTDRRLRPIRDNDSDDEILTLVGKPQPQGVPA